MNYREFISHCDKTHREHPEWRAGQAYFNALAEVNPSLAEYITGKYFDPFHNDKALVEFLDIVFGYYQSFGSVTNERRGDMR